MRWFKGKEFSFYFLVGGVATLIDWATYALSLQTLGHEHYLVSVIVSMGLAGTFHYFANKRLTFQCQSRAIGKQIPLYVGVALAGLGMSIGILRVLVGTFGLSAMMARVLTTAMMLLPNYLMHKYLTFSKKIFNVGAPPAS